MEILNRMQKQGQDEFTKIMELLKPAILSFNDVTLEQRQLSEIILSDQLSSNDKIRNIRKLIIKLKNKTYKLDLPDDIYENDFFKEKSNKTSFEEIAEIILNKLIKHNDYYTEIGKVISNENLNIEDKLEKLENLIASH